MESELKGLLEKNNNTKRCAHCDKELKENYFKVLENFLQVKFYTDPEGEDNMFCSEECVLKSLFVEEMTFGKEIGFKKGAD
ncbi:hypothetical protein P7H60_06345 [Vagococcus carniphilus]|uniref:hypothetical protein n=1 Tax=Vagococcus carniphilus TaxID=218144 RepID=UPI00288ECC73|nr:hypothetical protein [Vagococcus carniphilus]MDT2848776.1 hypothetical protein [Vagococcus carniphilus]